MGNIKDLVLGIKTAKSNLKSGLNEVLPSDHQIGNEKLSQYPSFLEHIEIGSGGGGGTTTIDVTINGSSAIICAELPNITMQLKDSGGNILSTKNTGATGGVCTFSVSGNGTYSIVALTSDNTELWTNIVYVTGVGTYYCKTSKPLNDYTWEEINTASTGGYAKYMWSVEDEKTFVSTGSILNNYVAIIIGFGHDDLVDGVSKAGITFMFKKYYTGANYMINPRIYLNGSSAYRNTGGYRASQIRQRFQAQGESCYSQATGVTAEILASGFKYFDGSACPLFSYTESTDTFSNASEETFSTSKVYFVSGYYKELGTITEEQFEENKYFTYASSTYTLATSWTSGTKYYCLYPTLQENGVFYNALSSIMQYIKPVKKKQNTGNGSSYASYLSETTEKVWMLCAEEIWGVNRNSTSFQGSIMQNAGFYNSAGEGIIYDYFKNNFIFSKIASANSYWWTRSPYTNYNISWSGVYFNGNITSTNVYSTNCVRPCFCI